MPTNIYIPLGLIVDTQIERTLDAFQKQLSKYGITLDEDLLKQILPMVYEYCLGRIKEYKPAPGATVPQHIVEKTDTQVFKWLLTKLLLKNKNFIGDKDNFVETWNNEEKFAKNWNAQCQVTEQSVALLNLIVDIGSSTKDRFAPRVIIVSQTNEANIKAILKAAHAQGVDTSKLHFLLSYKTKKPSEDMLYDAISAMAEDTDIHQVVLGDPMNYPAGPFRDQAISKNQAIATKLDLLLIPDETAKTTASAADKTSAAAGKSEKRKSRTTTPKTERVVIRSTDELTGILNKLAEQAKEQRRLHSGSPVPRGSMSSPRGSMFATFHRTSSTGSVLSADSSGALSPQYATTPRSSSLAATGNASRASDLGNPPPVVFRSKSNPPVLPTVSPLELSPAPTPGTGASTEPTTPGRAKAQPG